MLTASQAAAILGVSRSKMYDLAARGRLPCYRIDSALHFEQVELEAFKTSCRFAAIAPPPPIVAIVKEAPFIEIISAEQIEEGRRLHKKALREQKKARALSSARQRRALLAFHASKRRTAKLTRTPPWADLDAIKAVYSRAAWLSQETGVAHHVDHIVPLQGKFVSGLHVHQNLQVLSGSENSKKRNHFEVEE